MAEKLQCPKCEKDFKSNRLLGLHKRNAHGIASPRYEEYLKYREAARLGKTKKRGRPRKDGRIGPKIRYCRAEGCNYKGTRGQIVTHYYKKHALANRKRALIEARNNGAAIELAEPNLNQETENTHEHETEIQLQRSIIGLFGNITEKIAAVAQSSGLPYLTLASRCAELLYASGDRGIHHLSVLSGASAPRVKRVPKVEVAFRTSSS